MDCIIVIIMNMHPYSFHYTVVKVFVCKKENL